MLLQRRLASKHAGSSPAPTIGGSIQATGRLRVSRSSPSFSSVADDLPNPTDFQQSKRDWELKVKANGLRLGNAPGFLRSNKELVLAAVQQDGRAIRHASPILQGDKAVVVAAAQENPIALRHACYSLLRADRNFMMLAVQLDGLVLKEASPHLQDDVELVTAAVSNNGLAFEFASDRLRGSSEVAMRAAAASADALRYVCAPLSRHDPDLVRAAGLEKKPKALSQQDMLFCGVVEGSSLSELSAAVLSELREQMTRYPNLERFNVICQNVEVACRGTSLICRETEDQLDLQHPCLGDCGVTCVFGAECPNQPQCCTLGSTAPPAHSCWRHLLRKEMKRTKASGGFMVQVVEQDPKTGLFSESRTSQLSAKIAKAAALKVFTLEVWDFEVVEAAAHLAKAIDAWVVVKGRRDSSRVVIRGHTY